MSRTKRFCKMPTRWPTTTSTRFAISILRREKTKWRRFRRCSRKPKNTEKIRWKNELIFIILLLRNATQSSKDSGITITLKDVNVIKLRLQKYIILQNNTCFSFICRWLNWVQIMKLSLKSFSFKFDFSITIVIIRDVKQWVIWSSYYFSISGFNRGSNLRISRQAHPPTRLGPGKIRGRNERKGRKTQSGTYI